MIGGTSMISSKYTKKQKETKKQKKRMETSKKLAWFSGICFAIVLIYSMLIFTYCTIINGMCDATLIVTLVTVTGATFGVTVAFYYNKSRFENIIKLQKSTLKSKYLILKDINALDECRVQMELENEFSKIDSDIESEKLISNQEVTYNG